MCQKASNSFLSHWSTQQHKTTQMHNKHTDAALIVRGPLPSFEVTRAISQLTWSFGYSYSASASANIISNCKAAGFATNWFLRSKIHLAQHSLPRILIGRHEISSPAPATARLRLPKDFQACYLSRHVQEWWLLGISISRIHSQPKPLGILSSQANDVSRHIFSLAQIKRILKTQAPAIPEAISKILPATRTNIGQGILTCKYRLKD